MRAGVKSLWVHSSMLASAWMDRVVLMVRAAQSTSPFDGAQGGEQSRTTQEPEPGRGRHPNRHARRSCSPNHRHRLLLREKKKSRPGQHSQKIRFMELVGYEAIGCFILILSMIFAVYDNFLHSYVLNCLPKAGSVFAAGT